MINMFNENQKSNFNKTWDKIRQDIDKLSKKKEPLTEREWKKLDKLTKQEYYHSQFDNMFDNIFDKISRW